MKKLDVNIEISGFVFDFVNEISLQSSWDLFTDTARIVLPRKLRFKRNGQVLENITKGDNSIFKRGDRVKVSAGYDGNLTERFNGYIRRVIPDKPMVFECEDEMYTLKNTSLANYSVNETTLSSLLTAILPAGISFQANDVKFGGLRFSNGISVSEVLDYLKKEYGLVSYFQNGTLYSGLAYLSRSVSDIVIHDIRMDGARGQVVDKSNLEYKNENDLEYELTFVSILSDNTKLTTTRGISGGNKRTLHYYDLTQEGLEAVADEVYPTFFYTGYSGQFTTFLEPQIKHGDGVRLISEAIPDHNDDVYLVKSVETLVSVDGGGRQIVELDYKI